LTSLVEAYRHNLRGSAEKAAWNNQTKRGSGFEVVEVIVLNEPGLSKREGRGAAAFGVRALL
jgi:hypothetical protein